MLLFLLTIINVVQPSLETVECDDGDVRLVTGDTRGQVEVCVNKRWLTVCHNYEGWSDADATVVCRQLGYASGKNVFTIAHLYITVYLE